MKYDFLIVGQGIAGSIIGLQLEQYNQRFLIVDKNEKITSSKVAAGLMHPMSFKRCVLNWKGKLCMTTVINFTQNAMRF